MYGLKDHLGDVGERLVVVNDMDGTMIDDKVFFRLAAGIIDQVYPDRIDPIRFSGELADYYLPADDNPDIKSYDFFAHIGNYDLPSDAVEELVRARMSDPQTRKQYIHRYVSDYLQTSSTYVDNHCGTIGKPRTQRLKLYCSGLQDWFGPGHTHIMEEPKGSVLTRLFRSHKGVLVDDKVVAELPRNFTQYHMVYAGVPDTGIDAPGLKVVHSYLEVARAVGSILGVRLSVPE